MENPKYKAEDLMITVLNILHFSSWCYANIAFRLAIKFHCKDLKGLITVGCFEPSDLELLQSLDDPILFLIGESIGRFETTINSIAGLYGIEGKDIIDDEKILRLAADFYCQTIIDGIPLDNEDEDRISYDETLDLYALSLINVINWLCILVKTGDADLSLSFDENHSYTDFMDWDNSREEHVLVLGLLKNLGLHLHRQYFAIMEMH